MVLIENMEKPKECHECPILPDFLADCPLLPKENPADTFEEQYKQCPLKEVQE